jgi:hypothetical protein
MDFSHNGTVGVPEKTFVHYDIVRERFTDLNKLDFLKFAYGGLFLGSS